MECIDFKELIRALLTYSDQQKIYEDIKTFFGADYTSRKMTQRGARSDPQVVVNFLNATDLFFKPIGLITGENYKYGYFMICMVTIDIYTQDKLGKSGYKEGYEKAMQFREYISKKWRCLSENTNLRYPIYIRDLSHILTGDREYRFQIEATFLTYLEWDESDLHTSDIYAEYFDGVLQENTTSDEIIFNTKEVV